MENQNPNNAGGQQTINVQIPSADNIASRRPLIPVSFALAIIFFFFTFCDFKCGGQKIGSIKGIELVTGTTIKDHDMMSGQETRGEKIPASMWAILAFGAAIIGLGAFLIKEKREAIIGTGAGAIGAGSMIILQFVIKSAMDDKGKGQIDCDFQFPYWGALIALGVAGLISYLRMRQTHNVVVNFSPPPQTTSASPTAENISQPQVQTVVQPTQQTGGFDLTEWLKKNSKKVIGAFISILVLYGAYYFLLRHDPVNDGKKIATQYCDCYKNQNAQMITTYNKFISDFDTYKFNGRQSAWNKLNELQQQVTNEEQHCLDKCQEKMSNLREHYIADKDEKEKFEYAYNAQQGLCNNSSNEVSALYNTVSSKINNFVGQVEIEQARQDSIRNANAATELARSLEYAANNLPSIDKIQQDIHDGVFHPIPQNEFRWTSWRFAPDENFISFNSLGNSFHRENLSCTCNVDMTVNSQGKHYYIAASITYNWNNNTNTWNYQSVVISQFRRG